MARPPARVGCSPVATRAETTRDHRYGQTPKRGDSRAACQARTATEPRDGVGGDCAETRDEMKPALQWAAPLTGERAAIQRLRAKIPCQATKTGPISQRLRDVCDDGAIAHHTPAAIASSLLVKPLRRHGSTTNTDRQRDAEAAHRSPFTVSRSKGHRAAEARKAWFRLGTTLWPPTQVAVAHMDRPAEPAVWNSRREPTENRALGSRGRVGQPPRQDGHGTEHVAQRRVGEGLGDL
jgi:hypothetical protein